MVRILVVDDIEANRYLLTSLLQGHGYEVVAASNGADALDLARREPPDLVVSDVLMPGMDGFELCRRWHEDEGLRTVPFVVHTATFTEPEDERLALDLGADLFLAKPISPDRVIEEIRGLLAREAGGERGKAGMRVAPGAEALLKQHNEALLRKLEKKVRALEAEIAERSRLEAELQASLSLLRVAGRIARIGGWRLDLPDLQVRWSEEVAAILEVPPGKSYGFEEALAFFVPQHRPGVRRAFAECMARGTPFDLEAEVITAAGLRLWVRTLGEARKDEAGAILRLKGAFQDITDRVKAEAERRLLQEELFHSQKLESIGRLAAGVGHDINNMLAAIAAYTELAMGSLEEENPLRADLQEIAAAGQRAAGLVRQLLAFGRKQPLEPRLIDLNSVVRGIEGMVRRLLGEGVGLALDLREPLDPVLADPSQLEQALVNLAVNANDAMPDGGTLTIATAQAEWEGGGRAVALLVTDTGAGMDPGTRDRIFEPFFTTKAAGKGTGLGLSIVYGIVNQSGGRISVDSALGRGTTFRIDLPSWASPESASEPLSSAAEG